MQEFSGYIIQVHDAFCKVNLINSTKSPPGQMLRMQHIRCKAAAEMVSFIAWTGGVQVQNRNLTRGVRE